MALNDRFDCMMNESWEELEGIKLYKNWYKETGDIGRGRECAMRENH